MRSSPKRSVYSVGILSEAQDARRQYGGFFGVDHHDVRAQHCCAQTCPGVNFNSALFLTLGFSF
jgi:hypothetical protein